MSTRYLMAGSVTAFFLFRVDTSIGNNFGETPLHLAARDRAGGVERVELLLRSGCDPRAVDILGQTPLHAAAKALNLGVCPLDTTSFLATLTPRARLWQLTRALPLAGRSPACRARSGR